MRQQQLVTDAENCPDAGFSLTGPGRLQGWFEGEHSAPRRETRLTFSHRILANGERPKRLPMPWVWDPKPAANETTVVR